METKVKVKHDYDKKTKYEFGRLYYEPQFNTIVLCTDNSSTQLIGYVLSGNEDKPLGYFSTTWINSFIPFNGTIEITQTL